MRSPADILDYIDQSIHAVVHYPGMWGGPEAVELQWLALIQMRRYVLEAPGTATRLSNLGTEFLAWCRGQDHPDLLTNLPLFSQVESPEERTRLYLGFWQGEVEKWGSGNLNHDGSIRP